VTAAPRGLGARAVLLATGVLLGVCVLAVGLLVHHTRLSTEAKAPPSPPAESPPAPVPVPPVSLVAPVETPMLPDPPSAASTRPHAGRPRAKPAAELPSSDTKPSSDCATNYYFDGDGNKHFKPECF
jgi:hypothetical protein